MHRLAAALIGLGFAISACTTFSGLTLGDDANVVNPNGKTTGSACAADNDCQSGACSSGKCSALASASSTNGKKDGKETDVDCGGGTAAQCDDGKVCEAGTDCVNGVCKETPARRRLPDDGIKNGDETDIDCGGAKAPKCMTDKTCAADGDCTSGACAYTKKCLGENAKSCAQHFGGDTCGAGDTGAADAQHESCCTTVRSDSGLTIGKYEVTAGRMRAFAKKFEGNLRAWAETSPPGWLAEYTVRLPSTMDEVDGSFGPLTKRGCSLKASGGRTWWQDTGDAETSDFSQDVLDEKALNCFPWYLAVAICAYDGGRLPTNAEVQAMITNNGTTDWPWGGSYGNQAKQQDPHLVHFYSHRTEGEKRISGGEPVDRATYMAPPGRRPSGANRDGVQDVLGNMLPWVSNGYNKFAWTVSWEEHTWTSTMGDWSETVRGQEGAAGIDGYYAIGARCVFDR